MFEELEQVRQTKSSLYGFIAGQLLAKSASIEAELALTSQNNCEQILAACQVTDLWLLLQFWLCIDCRMMFVCPSVCRMPLLYQKWLSMSL